MGREGERERERERESEMTIATIAWVKRLIIIASSAPVCIHSLAERERERERGGRERERE